MQGHAAMPSLTRRAVLPGLLAVALATDTPRAARRPDGTWRLLYVGAEDCAPCLAWRRAHWLATRDAPVFAALQFIEVRAARSTDVLQDANWPTELRPFRTAIPAAAGMPFWLLLRGEAVVQRAWGERAWQAAMLPALRRAVVDADRIPYTRT